MPVPVSAPLETPPIGADARPSAPWVASLPLPNADAASAQSGQAGSGRWMHVRRLWGHRPVAGEAPTRAPRLFGVSEGRARFVRVVERDGWLGVDLYADRPTAAESPVLLAYGQLPSAAEATRAGALPLITVQRISVDGAAPVSPAEAAAYLASLTPSDVTAQAQCAASIRHYEAVASRLSEGPEATRPAPAPTPPASTDDPAQAGVVVPAADPAPAMDIAPAENVAPDVAPVGPPTANSWAALSASAPVEPESRFSGPDTHPSLRHMETVTRLLLVCDDGAVVGGLTRLASKLRSPFALVPRDAAWLAGVAAEHADRLRVTSLWQCQGTTGSECWMGSAPTPAGCRVVVATGPEAGLRVTDAEVLAHADLAWAARRHHALAPALTASSALTAGALAPVLGLTPHAASSRPGMRRFERLAEAAATDAAAAADTTSRFRALADELAVHPAESTPPAPASPAPVPGARTWRGRPA